MSEDHCGYRVERADGILTLSFDRPGVGNAVPQAAVSGLTELFRSLAADRSVRVLLVRGEGRHFCSGGDVGSFAAALNEPVADRQADFGRRLDGVKAMVQAYLAIEMPVIAACQGAVAGAGLMFALGADIVLGDETVVFLFSHQRIGLTPDGGVSLLLPRVVGRRRAIELVLTAARVEAEEAHRIGLASRIVDANVLQGEARKQALRFARAPVDVIRTAKRLVSTSDAHSDDEQLQAERDAIVVAVGTADFAEGVRAFIEKRSADFPSAR